MNEPNTERALVALLKEVCASRNIQLTGFSDDWVFCLQKDGHTTYVIGYDFGLNSATAKMICKDKTASSDLLGFHGVPHVEHRIFHSPQLVGYIPLAGNWQSMLAYFESCGRNLVCKPNEGTSGQGVFHARNEFELESAVLQIFATNRSLCLSPYEKIAGEYRVGVLHGDVQFVYRKHPLTLLGDGQRTVRDLLLARLGTVSDLSAELEGIKNLTEMQLDFQYVPASNEKVALNWRHNLGQGAVPEIIDPKSPQGQTLIELALRATTVLGVALASVDIVQTTRGLKVLEINCGIMMESLVRHSLEGRNIARRFYDRIVCAALCIEKDM